MSRWNILGVKYLFLSVLVIGVISANASASFAQESDKQCASDGTIKVCVVSAAVTMDGRISDDARLVVSMTLRFEVLTDYPVELLLGQDFSFMPRNAIALTPRYTPKSSGISNCIPSTGSPSCRNERPTTLFPRKPVQAQITYTAEIDSRALGLIQIASNATFSVSLYVTERSKSRTVALPLPEFTFGNGVTTE